MYKIRTEFEFEAAHKLTLSYPSKCAALHGHSYKCAVTIASDCLDENGMICDFSILKNVIKERVESQLDHQYLNDIFHTNATAEMMSEWIAQQVTEGLLAAKVQAKVTKVELNETSKNKAIWEAE